MAWSLIAFFLGLPYVRIEGRPAVLLDLPHREFLLFGARFLATDTVLFMLLMISTLIGIFLVTSVFGRVWCGWGCPQTVYMEFLYRPIEYWIEGGPRGVQELDRRGGLPPRRSRPARGPARPEPHHQRPRVDDRGVRPRRARPLRHRPPRRRSGRGRGCGDRDRKSTRLNSSH